VEVPDPTRLLRLLMVEVPDTTRLHRLRMVEALDPTRLLHPLRLRMVEIRDLIRLRFLRLLMMAVETAVTDDLSHGMMAIAPANFAGVFICKPKHESIHVFDNGRWPVR
jgi:hypothetical protein